jgi:Secretion system C-terminal sorting domain
MKRSLFSALFLILGFGNLAFGQQFMQITPISPVLGESSGLIFLDGKIITHNDSGGDAALFEIDSLTGDYTRKVVIANASNVDWEDITADSNYIYIGDIGNNAGNRTNLRIYRVAQNDYWNTPNDTITADIIHYAYADQSTFNYLPEATNWDCEALAAMNDSLYLFTKNWVNAKTYVYVLPKVPGSYLVPKSDSIFVQGLITGADYHGPSDRLILSGYTQFPFVVEMNNPLGGDLSQNTFVRYNLPNTTLIQLESIVTISDNNYYLTAETFMTTAVRLYRLSGKNGISGLENRAENPLNIYPNPTKGLFTIDLGDFNEEVSVKIFQLSGEEIPVKYEQNGSQISVKEQLKSGLYILQIGTEMFSKQVSLVVE